MAQPRTIEDVVCPFCSLACDDLVVEAAGPALRLAGPPCPIAEREFAAVPATPAAPTIEGEPVSLEAAVERAALILTRARLPLYGGLGTDVAGTREVLALAERTGGVVDHAGSDGLLANIRALQDGGWVTATLAEVRNRADLVLFVATDALAVAPRLVERCLAPTETLFGPLRRELVYLGDGLRVPAGGAVSAVPCPPERLPAALAQLRALAARDEPSGEDEPAEAGSLRGLAGKLRRARYPVIVWTAATLPGRQADLLVGMLAGLLQALNARGRCVGLPLAGASNVIGVNQVCAWQTGVPLRTSFAAGAPDHDPLRWSAEALLRNGLADALLWLSSLRELPLPAADRVPTVALVRPGDLPPDAAEVVIPVGVPGLDHAGSLYRTDSVVAMPVRALREPMAPDAAAVLRAIGEQLATTEGGSR